MTFVLWIWLSVVGASTTTPINVGEFDSLNSCKQAGIKSMDGVGASFNGLPGSGHWFCLPKHTSLGLSTNSL